MTREKDSRRPKALATKLFNTILNMNVPRVTFQDASGLVRFFITNLQKCQVVNFMGRSWSIVN